ncbi:DMT family transporter [Kerstersia gyiorum]|jgi:drug/metabolite transporter (DMT)-like permease|uniref:DMT family transporter n=1 Tax=Kerstersia gyiorum TaxID=206506 RepID=UPI0024319183|nr:DMT family transporter [Kerstersia gyiorum]MCH4270851.1 DMT family transporter [Kerstersia gyiorum]MCI1229427.1 DMT family transporter [Kerstersia gyiorum]
MQTRKPIDGAATAAMLLLCLIWGMQQVSIKAIAADVAPVLQVALRSGVAAVLVLLFSRLFLRERWLPGIALGPGLVAGLLFALEFLCVALGLRWTSAAHMSVFLYTAPIFAAIGLHWKLPEERLQRMQWVGIALAFAGIVITFLGPQDPQTLAAAPNPLLGDLFGLGAGLTWGLTTITVRVTRLSEAPPAQTLFYQLACACALPLAFAYATGQTAFHGSPLAWTSLGFQTLVVCFFSYLTWFWLLRRYLAARLGILSFMSPLFGVAMGAWLLDEHLDASFIIGAVLVLSGMVIVNGHRLLARKR